jgi:antitoxin component HigA of HigAB toxin-antitoxin module
MFSNSPKRFDPKHFTLFPIVNEATYQRACNLAEMLDDMEFEQEEDELSKFAFLDAITTLILAYQEKEFTFQKSKLTLPEILEQALD